MRKEERERRKRRKRNRRSRRKRKRKRKQLAKYLMAVGRLNAVCGGAQIGCSGDKVHVEVGVIVLQCYAAAMPPQTFSKSIATSCMPAKLDGGGSESMALSNMPSSVSANEQSDMHVGDLSQIKTDSNTSSTLLSSLLFIRLNVNACACMSECKNDTPSITSRGILILYRFWEQRKGCGYPSAWPG